MPKEDFCEKSDNCSSVAIKDRTPLYNLVYSPTKVFVQDIPPGQIKATIKVTNNSGHELDRVQVSTSCGSKQDRKLAGILPSIAGTPGMLFLPGG
jgi:hypothetical protein